MWICLSDSFLSIVNSDQDPTVLMVRARHKGDVEAVFGPETQVTTIPGRDHQFRAFLRRDIVGMVIAQAITQIAYFNFKNSVKDPYLHDAYAQVWGVMADLQEIRPCDTEPRQGFRKHPVR
ncbi:hypothetical protein [Paraburkholderia dilworthii]|uniref:hypothetical protein n=1 Tax=Paraburkholderia dilworthii TaxID=948106 RepID=UPI00040621C7|nr:hypothetical protein [Paraburkholderia dilworthii]